MGNPTAFITKSKIHQDSIDPKKRIKNYKEFVKILTTVKCLFKVLDVWIVAFLFAKQVAL